MSEERPQIIAQKRFLEHKNELEQLDLKGRFDYIFDTNLWGDDQSRSGVGSTLPETETLRREIPLLLRDLGARSLLDIPCGDFGWLSLTELGVDYTGADIVEALVAQNTSRYASEQRRFLRLDLTADPLPQADVVLCRDCLVHLRYANIRRALDNVKRSGAQYFLTTSFPEVKSNRDIEDGDWRPLNFQLAPFCFPAPARTIVENCIEAGGAYRDKSLCLWPVAELR
jgi:2-polyprenyl-3-methyl-5-hydroxy-6-metoxy-1,4-benzoquinol methylase